MATKSEPLLLEASAATTTTTTSIIGDQDRSTGLNHNRTLASSRDPSLVPLTIDNWCSGSSTGSCCIRLILIRITGVHLRCVRRDSDPNRPSVNTIGSLAVPLARL